MKTEKKGAAEILFMTGWSQKEIATTLDISEKTVSAWATVGQWKGQRIKRELAGFEASETMQDIFLWQLKKLKAKTVELDAEETNTGKVQLIDKGHFDALNKAYAIIKPQNSSWAQKAQIITELLGFVKTNHPELAQSLIKPTQAYLEMARKEMDA